MKKISIITLLVSALLIFAFAVANTQAQITLEFFTAKEGLQSATTLANQNVVDAKLVNIITFNGTFDFGLLNDKGQFKYSGDSIGMANIWVYTFVPEDSPAPEYSYQVVVLLPTGIYNFMALPVSVDFNQYGFNLAYNKYIDTDKMLNSDVFATELANNELFDDFQFIIENEPNCFNAIGVAVLLDGFNCIKSNKLSWIRYLQGLSTIEEPNILCCQTDFDNIDNLTCDKYISILEDYSESNIDVFPSPTKDFINISNPSDEPISSIDIYDVEGNILSNFTSNPTTINVSTLQTGNYYISFKVGNRKIFRSFIIDK